MKNLRNKLSLKENGKLIVIIFGIIGVMLIVMSYGFNERANADSPLVHDKDELEEYGKSLENKLESTLSSVVGKGGVEVMITFSGDFERVYTQMNNNSENGYLNFEIAGTSSNTPSGSVTFVKKKNPKIGGVMIVCKKKINANGYTAIKKAVATALDISESKIYIIRGEENHEKIS